MLKTTGINPRAAQAALQLETAKASHLCCCLKHGLQVVYSDVTVHLTQRLVLLLVDLQLRSLLPTGQRRARFATVERGAKTPSRQHSFYLKVEQITILEGHGK